MIIKGYILTKKEVYGFIDCISGNLGLKKEEHDDIDEAIFLINQNIIRYRKIQIYAPVCCSPIKKYILGICINKYKRICVTCDNCSEYNCCDSCFGQTQNGFYDTSAIHTKITKINKKHICEWRLNDNKTKITDNCKFCNFKLLEENKQKIGKPRFIRTEIESMMPAWFEKENGNIILD